MKTVEQVQARIAEYQQELADTLAELSSARERLQNSPFDTCEAMDEIDDLLVEKERLHQCIDTLNWLLE